MEQPTTAAQPAPTWMLRLGDGGEFGPADLNLLEEWVRQGRVPHDGLLVEIGDPSRVRSVFAEPRLARLLKAPPTMPFTAAAVPAGGASALIPYANPPALIAYYCGIFALIPGIGALLGVAAFILGIIGFMRYRRKPEIKGAIHAWVGIILGGLLTLAWGALLVWMFAEGF